jgi:hypothetical protein
VAHRVSNYRHTRVELITAVKKTGLNSTVNGNGRGLLRRSCGQLTEKMLFRESAHFRQFALVTDELFR